MIQSIGSSQTSGLAQPAGNSAGQSSELARLEKELSACINCDSAKTQAGREKIAAVSQRIEQIHQRVNQAEQQKTERPSGTVQNTNAAQINENIPTSAQENTDTYARPTLDSLNQSPSSIGSRINIRV